MTIVFYFRSQSLLVWAGGFDTNVHYFQFSNNIGLRNDIKSKFAIFSKAMVGSSLAWRINRCKGKTPDTKKIGFLLFFPPPDYISGTTGLTKVVHLSRFAEFHKAFDEPSIKTICYILEYSIKMGTILSQLDLDLGYCNTMSANIRYY